jgi:Ni,Fe-hydrogenase III large subunit/Ni,Fe-hydrogenase III component G
MSHATSMLSALNAAPIEVSEVSTPRANEVHCRVAAAAVKSLADFAWKQLESELILMLADDRRQTPAPAFAVHYLFANRRTDQLLHASTYLEAGDPRLPSLAPFCYPASRFEREIRDLFGIRVVGHPDQRPLVKHGFWPEREYPLRKDARISAPTDEGQPFPFTAVGGEGVYEIPVGPVHAGVIEPGHFRFNVMGETIIDMKTRLYFTHKGTEKLFEGRDPSAGVELAERISGDTSVGHPLAYCQAIESAAGVEVPLRARLLRVVFLELERLYNHIGDYGAMANDTGFAIAQAHSLRIRERLLRLNKRLTGSRLLRGVLCPGGLSHDPAVPPDLVAEVEAAVTDFLDIVAICANNTLVQDRFEGTGVLNLELARDFGVLGYVARASGIDIDARRDHPFAEYGRLEFQVPVMTSGDVRARAAMRVEEVQQSAGLVRQAAARLTGGPVRSPLGRPGAFAPAWGIVEGWRGRIVHWVTTGDDGRLHRVKIVDPSFFNWPALSRALTGNIVPDFPLCNKSFNQSYSGHDL